ncbi:hypothetical protein HDF26_004445 [Pedobacter cryoconitis]|uniref:DUF3828 domain-containing protein n=1 Tax=Pedobacter cryoconitis TaxID=188932 RepID=A0A7W8ZND2_9SPHI|nr:DUF3828 domain-containing protein [Pedobacter cryoconitis]MBB5637212.1 hypothetical protein [Pedobacter cryoconitis]MBB6273972.1 hypothetical protein [Pedobacter cryoconitis]
MKIKILLSSLIAVTIFFGCSNSKNNAVTGVVDSFYKHYSGKYVSADKGLLSDSLSALIDKALAKEAESAEKIRNSRSTEKPAVIEGDIFTSLSQGYTGFKIGDIRIEGDKAIASVEFKNKDQNNITWKDDVVLLKNGKKWKIDNVNYKGETGAGKNTKDVLAQFSSSAAAPVAMVGGDADAHGCKASAGYTWSTIKKACIRVFELPLKLSDPKGSMIAGVVIADDKKQAEVFAKEGNFILTRKSETSYASTTPGSTSFLEKKNGLWEFGISKDGKALYTESKK